MSYAAATIDVTGKRSLLSRLRLKLPFLIWISAIWLTAILVVAVFADQLRPYEITRMDLGARMAGFGTPGHWLGTDDLGRDVFSRLMQSIRVSLVIAFGATILSGVVGTGLGFLAAQFRGWVENAVMALADFQAALPFLIMSLAVLAFFGRPSGAFAAEVPQGCTHGTRPASSSAMILLVISS